MDNNLTNLTIVKARQGLKNRQFSCRELVQSHLDAVSVTNQKLNSFITVCGADALKKAEKADILIQKSAGIFDQKPLLGIPFGAKDLFCTKGVKTTAGSNVLAEYIPQYSATAINRLVGAGAILIGKNNCDAWAHGSSGENSDFGPTKNPWDLSRVPGGSSSGSAVAVASGQALFSTGTDTGGSIRFPAGFCNVVGLKPTYGRVSRYGVVAMASSLDTIGHFTKTVEDSSLILSVTAGDDVSDATTLNKPVGNYQKEIGQNKTFKIGLPKEYFSSGINPEVAKLVQNAINILKQNGYCFKEVSLPHTKYAIATYYILQPAEVSSNLARYTGIRYGHNRSYFKDEAKRRIMLGTYVLSSGYYDAYYQKAMRVRTLIAKDFDRVFKEVDMLLTPISPFAPFALGEKIDDPLQMYLADVLTVAVSLAGLPGMAVPCGFTNNNLPVGMQLVAPHFAEDRLFQTGHKYQQLNPTPGVQHPVLNQER